MLWVSEQLGANDKPGVTGFNARVTPDGLLVEALLITRGAPTGTCTGVLLHSESERERVSITVPPELAPVGRSYVVHPNPRTPDSVSTIVNNQYFMLMEVNK